MCQLVKFARLQIAHRVVKSLVVCFLASHSNQVIVVLGFSRISLERQESTLEAGGDLDSIIG